MARKNKGIIAQKTPESVMLEDLAKAWKTYYNDPVGFNEKFLRFHPDPWQCDVMDAVAEYNRVALKGANGIGKTGLECGISYWYLSTRPYAKVPMTAGVGRQVNLYWAEMHKWYRSFTLANYFDIQTQAIYMKDQNGDNIKDWFGEGFTADEAGKAEGYHSDYLLYLTDEGKAVREAIYNAIPGALTGKENKWLLMSVPGPEDGFFYKVFTSLRGSWKTFSIPSGLYITPTTDKVCEKPLDQLPPNAQEIIRKTQKSIQQQDLPGEWIANPLTPRVEKDSILDKLKYGENSPIFVNRVLAGFVPSTPDQLIPLSWAEAAIELFAPDMSLPLIVGHDVANSGDNESGVARRRGNVILSIEGYFGYDTNDNIGLVKRVLQTENPFAYNIDAIGVGVGVYDGTKTNPKVHAINVGNPAKETEVYANMRAEVLWYLRRRFELTYAFRVKNQKNIDPKDLISIPKDDELVAQLSTIRKKIKGDGKIYIERKEDMKRRGVKSPDRLDMVMLTFCPWKKKKTPSARWT